MANGNSTTRAARLLVSRKKVKQSSQGRGIVKIASMKWKRWEEREACACCRQGSLCDRSIFGISKANITTVRLGESNKELENVTHLHLQQKNLSSLESLQRFTSLTVLYLYDNELTAIDGLEDAKNLEILQLQRNRIKEIKNLDACTKLRKLYLGYNEIELVEGLENLRHLEELYLENQHLQRGICLTFDPKSLATLSNCLTHLNISANRIAHLDDFSGMKKLKYLVATNNPITDLQSVALVVKTLFSLTALDLRNTPISKRPHFREKIVGFSHNLMLLNEKEIPDSCRDFIKRFTAVKASRLEKSVRSRHEQQESMYAELSGSQGNLAGGDIKAADSASTAGIKKSNLALHLPYSDASEGRRASIADGRQPEALEAMSRSSSQNLSPTNSVNETAKNSQILPQFILAPPGFGANLRGFDEVASPLASCMSIAASSGNLSATGAKAQRGNRKRAPLFKSRPNHPANLTELWSGRYNIEEGRPILKIVKPLPMPESSNSSKSRMSVFEAEKPAPALQVDLNTSLSNDDRALYRQEIVARTDSFAEPSVVIRDKRKSRDKRALSKQFSSTVFEFPPWPHIQEHLSAVSVQGESNTLFIP